MRFFFHDTGKRELEGGCLGQRHGCQVRRDGQTVTEAEVRRRYAPDVGYSHATTCITDNEYAMLANQVSDLHTTIAVQQPAPVSDIGLSHATTTESTAAQLASLAKQIGELQAAMAKNAGSPTSQHPGSQRFLTRPARRLLIPRPGQQPPVPPLPGQDSHLLHEPWLATHRA
jgi:hypothetical protein